MMKKAFATTMILLTSCGLLLAQDKAKQDGGGTDILDRHLTGNDDRSAIEAAIESYVEAFNEGDAKALAAHWSEDGDFTPPSGEMLQGRGELEKAFTTYFAENEDAKLELVGASVQFFSPSVAVETGIARVILPDDEPSETEYEAVHVKTADGWKIDSIREQEPPAAPPSTHYEQLKGLEWMVGTWVDDGADGSSIETSCRWTTNNNFLVRTFKVYIEDRIDFEGTQVVGWDPHNEVIRSWLFDSDGGFAAGRWSGGGDRWTVHTLSTLPDGKQASSTNIYEVIDADTIQFSSIGRQVDGELLPNIDPVTVVRAAD